MTTIIVLFITLAFIIFCCILVGVAVKKDAERRKKFSASSLNGRLVLAGENYFEDGIVQYILYDPKTHVMYSFIKNGYSGGLSVMYNEDGTLRKYDVS